MDQEIIEYLVQNLHLVMKTREDIGSLVNLNYSSEQEKPILKAAEFRPNEIFIALEKISPILANSYAQIKIDIQDTNRKSWAGTAHEIREITATLLRSLAPDEEIKKQSWYKQEPGTSGPSQKQRVHYVMTSRSANSKEGEVVEQVAKIDELVEDLVRAIYSRASVAAHTYKPRREVARILRYFEAFANDLLNIE